MTTQLLVPFVGRTSEQGTLDRDVVSCLARSATTRDAHETFPSKKKSNKLLGSLRHENRQLAAAVLAPSQASVASRPAPLPFYTLHCWWSRVIVLVAVSGDSRSLCPLSSAPSPSNSWTADSTIRERGPSAEAHAVRHPLPPSPILAPDPLCHPMTAFCWTLRHPSTLCPT